MVTNTMKIGNTTYVPIQEEVKRLTTSRKTCKAVTNQSELTSVERERERERERDNVVKLPTYVHWN